MEEEMMKKSLGAKTIVYPTPVYIICTYDKDGKPNAMAVAWGGICCSEPPAVAIALRKATYTYGSIVEQKAFTVNITPEKYAKEADYFGIVSGRDEDKFAKTGLTPIKSEIVNAPYIKEFPLVLECKLIHTIELGLHTQFIGEIMDVKADEEILGENELPVIGKTKPIMSCPSDVEYYAVGKCLGKMYTIGKLLRK
jgi:flavin reductase (DIM6/NTAB) family NADH-FMN oxidoreductase RutF